MAQVQAEVSRAGSATYWPGLDGVRAFAVLSVMAYHLGRPEATGGYLGVDMFFVLSGFLITDMLLRENERWGGISLRLFYIRRALRLLPALAVVVTFAVVVALAWRGPYWSGPTLEGAPFVVAYVGNWYRAFGTETTLGLLVHTWSLAIEEQFYLLWPFVVLGAIAVRLRTGLRYRSLAVLLLVLAGLINAWRLFLLDQGSDLLRLASGLDTHSDGLVLGAALAFWLFPVPRAGPMVRRGLAALTAASVLVLLVLVTRLPPDEREAQYGYVLAALATATVVAGLATASVPRLTKVLEWSPARWIGRRSYGLYLWHFPIYLMLADESHFGIPGSIVATMVTFLVAALSYRYVEKPFLRLKSRFARVATPVPPG